MIIKGRRERAKYAIKEMAALPPALNPAQHQQLEDIIMWYVGLDDSTLELMRPQIQALCANPQDRISKALALTFQISRMHIGDPWGMIH